MGARTRKRRPVCAIGISRVEPSCVQNFDYLKSVHAGSEARTRALNSQVRARGLKGSRAATHALHCALLRVARMRADAADRKRSAALLGARSLQADPYLRLLQESDAAPCPASLQFDILRNIELYRY